MEIKLIQAEMIKANKLSRNNGEVEGLPRNPRIIRDERYEALKKSISESGSMLGLREIVAYRNVDDRLIVVGGNMRLKACKELGIKEIPCKILPTETPVEYLKEFVIKDNVAFGDNDMDALTMEWETESLEDWGMEFNFEEEEEAKGTPDFQAGNESNSEDEDYDYPEDDLQTSHVRMVQLFLNTETEPEIREFEQELRKHFMTDNLTDTIFSSMRWLYQNKSLIDG